MFQRGQKIVILESSASRKSHPAVGDAGYLDSAYFFFKHRFILFDAFFLTYNTDTKRGKDRCEKKRFIIDMGMKKILKYKLRREGIPKKFFVNNRYISNLTLAGYLFDNNYIEAPSIESMWSRIYTQEGIYRLNSCVKIPYGQIAFIPNYKRSISEESTNLIGCWLRCLAPVLSAEINTLSVGGVDGMNSISKLASHIYYDSFTRNKYGSVKKSIEGLRLVQVMAKSSLDSCDKSILKNPIFREYRNGINLMWHTTNIVDSIVKAIDQDSIPRHVLKAIINLYFRVILTTDDTKDQLAELSMAGFLPWNSAMVGKRSADLRKVKQAANSNSAALNRLFEEKLF